MNYNPYSRQTSDGKGESRRPGNPRQNQDSVPGALIGGRLRYPRILAALGVAVPTFLTQFSGTNAAANPFIGETPLSTLSPEHEAAPGKEAAPDIPKESTSKTELPDRKDERIEDPQKNYKAAQKVIEQFLAADTPEKKAAFVRHPEETLPRMKTFYAREAQPIRKVKKWEEQVEETSQSKPDSRETTDLIIVQAELEDFRVRQFALEIMPDGSPPRLDWEHHVSWSEIPWKKFLETASEQACDFRVRITPDDYFNYAFQDSQNWLCFRLLDPDDFGSCWAYCRSDSPAGKAILKEIALARHQGKNNENGDGIADCILKLRFPPEGRKHNQAVIEAFVHESWVIP